MKLSWKPVVTQIAAAWLGAAAAHAQSAPLVATVRNDLDLARREEMVEIPAAALGALAKPKDLAKVRVKEQGAATETLAQAVDLDGDAVPDQIVFLADFAPKQARTFELTLGGKRVY
ncbi:MAG: DUF4861 family protein, partial [Vicinamibacteria bacterium]